MPLDPTIPPTTNPQQRGAERIADLERRVRQLESLGPGPAWLDWTPALTATTTNPTLGTGSTATGRYARIGKVVHAQFVIAFGTSGTAAGTGAYRVSLPVSVPSGSQIIAGTGWIYDQSANVLRLVVYNTASATTLQVWYDNSGTDVAATVPWAWSTQDQLRGMLMYEAA